MSYIYPNLSNLSNYIINNTFLASNLLQTFVKKSIFLSTYSFSSSIDLFGSFFMFNYITTEVSKY